MLQTLLMQYGLITLGLFIFLESAGLPLPGETMLLLAAASASQGVLPIGGVVVVAAIAAIAGDNLGYWLGHRYGVALLTRYGRWLRVTPEHVGHATGFFQRHGAKTVFLGRFVALLRVLSAVLAGASGMRYAQFLFYNALGGIVWAAVVGALGFAFGSQLTVIESWLRQIGWGLAGIALAAVLGVLLWRWLVRHQSSVAARLGSVRQRFARSWLARTMNTWRARLSLWSYLGVHTTIGLGVSLAALLAFAQIADSALGQETLAALDTRVALELHRVATPLTTQAMRVVTAFGGSALVAIAFVGVVAFVARRRWAKLVLWVGALGGGGLLTLLLKALIQRPHLAAAPLDAALGWGFPSGHALMATITYGLLAFMLIARMHQWRWQVAVALAALFLIGLIGFSRMYLGVHYLSDVLAGIAAGTCWLATCLSAWAYRVAPPRRQAVILESTSTDRSTVA